MSITNDSYVLLNTNFLEGDNSLSVEFPDGAVVKYVPERTCRMKIVKQGPLYIVYSFDCCDKEWVESMTDGKATALDGTVCPYCGAKVVE